IDAVARDERYLSDIDLGNYPDYFTFTFVRDPFRRLVSCYLNKYQTDKHLLGMARHGLYEKDGYFDHYLLGFLARDRGFTRFARRVCLIPDALSDRHFVSQQFMLRDGDRQLAQFVGKMEDLPEAYEPIRKRYDLPPLARHNKTDSEDGWMDMYDLDTARRVARRYRHDIEAFGYQASRDALMAYLEKKKGNDERHMPRVRRGPAFLAGSRD
ncbi:MAG: sulfotransferase family 2 domain-containing protein, partial [Eubacteriales bacterium]|nr:sulfotransferase family 2 domain-containing protein [Eubacteriales bacterium]